MAKINAKNQVVEPKKEKKRRKFIFWWWFGGGLATLTLLITAMFANPFANQTSSSVVSSSSSIASSSSSAQVVNRVELIAIEVERLPVKLNYQATDVVSTLGGTLRLVYSDYSVKYVAMNDAMIDTSRLNLSRIGTSSITLRYEENGVVKFISYPINVIPFVVNPVKVSLDVSSADLLVGQSLNLNYIIEPLNATFNNVVWTSSNPNVATVDQSGVVSTRGVGTVLITVSVDGNLTATSSLNVRTLPVIIPPVVEEEPETIEPRGGDWIPISNGHDLMMIGVAGATYTFAADYPDASVTFSNTTLTPGLGGKYYLLNNIDLSTFDNTDYAWSGLVAPNSILPIGFSYNPGNNQLVNVVNVNQLTPFTGEFDGNNNKISGMNISLSGNYNFVGLFSSIINGDIYDLEIELSTINQQSNNYNRVGLLAGYIEDSVIDNVTIDRGSVVGKVLIGGLAGYVVSSRIENSNSSAEVTGDDAVGGLIGVAYWSEILDSYTSGLVTGVDYVGGLIGYLFDSEIYFSYATGSVAGRDSVGGLVGESLGDFSGIYDFNLIEDSYSTGNVSGRNDVGGLIGLGEDSKVQVADSTGNVSGTNNVGGLIGRILSSNNNSAIVSVKNVASFGNVEGNLNVGGLIGSADNFLIENVLSSSSTINGNENVGGLIGKSVRINFKNSQSDSNVIGNNSVGGLIGFVSNNNVGEITFENLYYSGTVTAKVTASTNDVDKIGGLFGHLEDISLLRVRNEGNIQIPISITNVNRVGGLVGYLDRASAAQSILKSESFSTISIANTGTVSRVGGLVGQMYDYEISESLSRGSIFIDSTGNSLMVGGLVGEGYDSIIFDSYAAKLINIVANAAEVGGLFGFSNNINILTTYYFGDISGANLTAAGVFIGKATATIVDKSYYLKDDVSNVSINDIGELSGTNTIVFLEAKTSLAFLDNDVTDFVGWDIVLNDSIWFKIPDDPTPPLLRWSLPS